MTNTIINRVLTNMCCAAVFGLLLPVYSYAANPQPTAKNCKVKPVSSVGHYEPALPINYPDKFAWQLFTRINKKAKKQHSISVSGVKVKTNSALWETWPDDPYTFPKKPNPRTPPVWLGQNYEPMVVRTPSKSSFHSRKFILDTGTPGGETVHRNKSTFDYVIQKGLWYRNGIAKYYATGKNIDFPTDAIEVKANWVPIKESEKSRYHWNYARSGKLFGLVAMHITSKALPNWFWATFEWKDNAGRCDFIGCHDCFGSSIADVASNTKKVGALYSNDVQSKALIHMFKKAGYSKQWLAQFSNYRLKASQTDFTDSTGTPLLVGNSVTEAGFVQTASCITCHSRAAVNAKGEQAFYFFGQQVSLPLQNLSPIKFQTQQTTYHGIPDPGWFYLVNPNTQSGQPQLLHRQTDFVYAIPFATNTVKQSEK